MQILHITRNLPPLVGGMERLNWHMADELSRGAQVRVVGLHGSAVIGPAAVRLSEAPLKPLPLFLVVAFFRALWITLHWPLRVVRTDLIVWVGRAGSASISVSCSKQTTIHSAGYCCGMQVSRWTSVRCRSIKQGIYSLVHYARLVENAFILARISVF